MGLFTVLSMAACSEQDKKAAEVIERHLKDKYGEEFVVEAVGGGYGNLNTNTLKAIVYPKDADFKKFDVEITKDFMTIWDSYMEIVMADKLDKETKELSSKYFEVDYTVKSYFSTMGMFFPDQKLDNKELSIHDYFTEETDSSIYFFVKSDGVVEHTEQANIIHSIANGVISLGVKNAYIRVFYVRPSVYQNIDGQQELLFNNDETYNFFSDKENSFEHSWLRIENAILLHSKDDIKGHFK
jgi:hypothetical protein